MLKVMLKRGEKMKARNVFVTCMLVSAVLSLLVGVSGAAWCDTDFDKRINVSVNNTGGSALTDYQVCVNLTSNPINETSLRVYNSSNCVLRSHWTENITNGNSTKLWINYSAVAASSWVNNTAIYYDNTGASSVSNGTNTFTFFDDGESGTYSNKWVDITGTGEYSTDEAYQGTKSVKFSATTDQTSVSKNVNVADGVFEAMVKNTGTNDHYTFLTARASQTVKTYYGYRLCYLSNAELEVRVAGAWTSLDTDSCSDDPATWGKWSIVCEGTSIKTYYNDALRNSVTNSTVVSGGIGTRGTSNVNQYLDNVRVRKYSSPEPSTTLGSEEYAVTYNVSGYAKSASGVAIENAYVANNRTAATNYTNASGYYILNLLNATYNISASKTLYITNYTVATVSGADIVNQNMTLDDLVCHKPPTPINLQNTSGSTWINWTWQADTGNITDSYNVSIGGTWSNDSSDTFYNKTRLCVEQSITISVYAFNNSKSDCISDFNVTDTATATGTLSWANSNYKYRTVACVQNITTGNYQINFSLHTGVGANNETDIFMNNHNETSDYTDIRIYNQTGTTLNYWIENVSIDPTKIWINATENGSVQIYYGHSGASSTSNGDNTFEFFDHFDGVESQIPNTNGAWCWFQDPRAVHYHGTYNKTYVGYITSTGDVNIWSLNHGNNDTEEYTLHSALEPDDHDAPTILIRNDGHIIVFYSKHGGDALARYRISTNIENISAWGAEQTTTFTRAITYPTPIQLPGESNKIYLFVRQEPASGKQDWVYKTSTDGGVSWSAVQMLVQSGIYLKIISNNNNTIYFTHSDHPISEVTSIYHFYYYNNALYKADGTKICDTPSGLPIGKSDMDMVYNGTEHYKAWIWDIALDVNTPIITFAHFVSNTDHRYDYAKWNGTGWNVTEMTPAGMYIDGPSQVHYSGGISIDKENPSIVYLSRQINSQWEIQKWTTTDGGSTWETPVNITSGSSNKNLRPIVVRNHTSDFNVLWMYGTYVHYYNDYNTVILSDYAGTEIAQELDSDKWSSGVSAFSVSNSYLQVQDIGTTNGSAYLDTNGSRTIDGWNPNDNILEFRHQGGTDIGSTTSLGVTGWYKNDSNSYFVLFTPSSGRSYDLRLDKRESGATTNLSVCCDNQYVQGSWYIFSLRKTDDTTLKLYQDETEKLSGTISNVDEDLKIGFQEWTEKTWKWDWVRIRKYVSLLPSITLGSEEEGPATTPVISNVINGSISATSQYIDWDVNQTAHNRVLYSNESDLTPAYYSTWDNSTAAPNITLSTLDTSTQYWYQAWSYNTTNTSLSDNSSTLNFTTAAGANPTLHIDNAINIKDDWDRDFNSNFSANVTGVNASNTWMNFTNAEFTNTSLGWLNLTLDEWVNDSHNVNAPVTNVSVTVFLNASGATNDTKSFYYEITNRTNTATMDSAATQNVDTSESFYVNATCNEEYSDTFYGAANLLEDGAIVATDSSVTNYVNFSHSESSAGVYNYTVRFYNLTHYNNVTTPTYSNVTVTVPTYMPPDPNNPQNTTGNYWVNHTWTKGLGEPTGNQTDSFNVSINLVWYNTTIVMFYNNSGLSAHDWSNISIWAYNNSGDGSLSNGYDFQDVQIPNNVPVLSGLPDNTTDEDINRTDIFDLDDYFTDADSDTPTYQVESNNQSGNVSVTINASNNVSYTLASGWNGTASVVINATDGWGGEDNDTFLIIVNAPPGPGDYIPGNPTTLANTTGNYWVNYTWNVGGGNVTDSYNVSWNLTWYNTTLVPYMNDTVGEFGWANISVWAYNSSGNGSLSVGSVSSDTQAGGGVFATTMTTGVYNLITYYGSANSSAEQFGDDIGNTDYVAMYNGSFYTHTMGFSANNFTTIHGIGYYVYLNTSGSSTYQRNNISDSPYNTQLYNRWNTIGWTNATDTNAEGIASSIGSACNYTSSLNADGITYTTHTVGFASNNHAVNKGKGYWVWVNTNTNWGRNS